MVPESEWRCSDMVVRVRDNGAENTEVHYRARDLDQALVAPTNPDPGPSRSVPGSVPLTMMQSQEEVILALRQLATNSSPNDDPASIHIRSGALFARLKALNRDANTAARTHKQITADARQDMDQTHLRLQNLLYEKRHLEREIDKCRQFAYVFILRPLFGSHSLTT